MRRLHNEELNYLGAQVKKNEMGGPCSMNGGVERCIQGFGMKSDGERTLGRPRHRWMYNIIMDLLEVEWWGWAGLIWLRIGMWRDFVNVVMNLWVPYNVGNFLTS